MSLMQWLVGLLRVNSYLAVEDVLWCALLILHVPDQCDSVRLMGSVLVVVIRGHQQLWILREQNSCY